MKATLYKKLNDGKILCTACAHACKLGEGEYGKCGVRAVKEGELELLVYGKAAALNIDPVEKKPLYHFLPSTKTLSVGTVGCNFSCDFCQNYEISQFPKNENHPIEGENVSPEHLVNLALHHNCDSISYTYNEPVVFFEYTYDTAKKAHEKGLKNIYVTSGYETRKALDTISPYLDAMNIDLKSFSDEFYKKHCKARLKPVLETIRYAYELGIFVEITTLIIPTLNDSNEELKEIAKFIKSVDKNIPWHVSAFHPTYKLTNLPRTPVETLLRAYEIGKKVGLNYVYVGNVNAPEFSTTQCPKCDEKVIKRHGYLGHFVENLLNKGKCPKCKYEIYGVWS